MKKEPATGKEYRAAMLKELMSDVNFDMNIPGIPENGIGGMLVKKAKKFLYHKRNRNIIDGILRIIHSIICDEYNDMKDLGKIKNVCPVHEYSESEIYNNTGKVFEGQHLSAVFIADKNGPKKDYEHSIVFSFFNIDNENEADLQLVAYTEVINIEQLQKYIDEHGASSAFCYGDKIKRRFMSITVSIDYNTTGKYLKGITDKIANDILLLIQDDIDNLEVMTEIKKKKRETVKTDPPENMDETDGGEK